MRNPPWSRDEHIIALNFYLKHNPLIPGKDSAEVKQLSELLNLLHQKLEGDAPDKFRNTSGVYMKLMNFRRFDPGYSGVGLAHGNKDEEVVWNLYANDREKLSELALNISHFVKNDESTKELPVLVEDEEEGNEGQLLSRVHRYRERDRTLVKKKKSKFLTEHTRLHCQACEFDFESTYGERGRDFIECHHTKPVSELDADGKTKLSDLILLCSNCHRIVHRKKPWLTFEELKQYLQKSVT
jgi:5-methylcytosine-specific restriction protein A